MIQKFPLLLALIGLTVCAQSATAESVETASVSHAGFQARAAAPAGPMGEVFADIDNNSSGGLSFAEVSAARPLLAKYFDRLEKNSDGQLTTDELFVFGRGGHGRRPHRRARVIQ